MKGKLLHLNSLQQVFVLLITSCVLLALGACTADEEPETAIGYYITIQSKYPIRALGGMPPMPKEKMIGDITSGMQAAIRKVYPVHDQQGDDYAVIRACDDLYRSYYEAYRDTSAVISNTLMGGSRASECNVVLYRARMSGIIVRASYPIKTYRF